MNKKVKIGLIVVVVAVIAFFAWKWWMRRKQEQQQSNLQSPTGSFGTNLNSVAPELVGGSAGPSVGSAPAVSLPVHISIETPERSDLDLRDEDFNPEPIPLGRSDKGVFRQRHSSGVISNTDQVGVGRSPESTGERGISQQEQDNIDQMDASVVA